jgi:hypothetical protein
MSRKRKRWIRVGAVLLASIVVGIFFGPVAGIALAVGVLTVFLFAFDASFGVGWPERQGRAWGEKQSGPDADKLRSWGEKQFGSDAAKRREH